MAMVDDWLVVWTVPAVHYIRECVYIQPSTLYILNYQYHISTYMCMIVCDTRLEEDKRHGDRGNRNTYTLYICNLVVEL